MVLFFFDRNSGRMKKKFEIFFVCNFNVML